MGQLVKRVRSAAEQNFSSMKMASTLEPTCTVDVHHHKGALLVVQLLGEQDQATPLQVVTKATLGVPLVQTVGLPITDLRVQTVDLATDLLDQIVASNPKVMGHSSFTKEQS